MAFSLHSVVLSSDESFLCHTKSRLPSGEKYNATGADSYGSVVVRMYSSKWNSRYMKLLKAHRICRGLGSRFSDLFRHEMDKLSSTYDNNTSKPERKMKFQFQDAVTFIIWKQWSYASISAIIIIFTLLVIPNANAVDALKTCACLLKECK